MTVIVRCCATSLLAGGLLASMCTVACTSGQVGASASMPSTGTGVSTPPGDAIAPLPPGGVNCGLPTPAFCDTFDMPSATHGRAGDLDPSKWSAGRFSGLLPTGSGNVFTVGMSTVPTCRADVGMHVFPDQDTLICDPTPLLASNHLLTATAVQNYGVNSYRIRQPFDFAGRIGTIVFDADASVAGATPALAWISVEVTEDPIAVPSFADAPNFEGGVLPKNGFELQFNDPCGNAMPQEKFTLLELHAFHDYVDTVQKPKVQTCVPVVSGGVNHFEIHVSQSQIDVYATPVSANGRTFDAPQLLFSAGVSLSFSRGYVHVSAHNHATLKYSDSKLNAALVRWDNVGFDGPVVTSWREYEVPDSLTAAKDPNGDPQNPEHTAKNLGYVIPDEASGSTARLRFSGVDLTGVKSARLAFTSWYPMNGPMPYSAYSLKYRVNGGAWQPRALTADEITVLTKPTVIVSDAPSKDSGVLGGLGQTIDVSPTDLVAGDNTIDLVATGISQNYPPGAVNIDLVLTSE